MKRSTKSQAPTARQTWIAGFLSQECCNQPMQSGYDVMSYACRHNNYEYVTENAYYIMCDVCGNGEILCSKCVNDSVEEASR